MVDVLKDQFGIIPKKKLAGYTKAYPESYDLVPLPPNYRLPEFSKFRGQDNTTTMEHINKYLAQLGTASAGDPLRVRLFTLSLSRPAFGWYTSLPAGSITSWRQLEEQFHMHFFLGCSEMKISDLAAMKQRKGETVSEYIQRFRDVKNKCYTLRLTEKETTDLAFQGLAHQAHEIFGSHEFESIGQILYKLSAHERLYPDLYQEKLRKPITYIQPCSNSEISEDEHDVNVAEWARGAHPAPCRWLKAPEAPRGFDFDVSKMEQIFDLVLKEKQLKLTADHKILSAEELKNMKYCKWHNSSYTSHQQVQSASSTGQAADW